jgi:uncharacterized protein (TIGR02646 family)
MLKLNNHPTITSTTQKRLNDLQSKIIGSFDEKVEKAQSLWDSKNNSDIGKEAFNDVKEVLKSLYISKGICHYCEHNKESDIEHIEPKGLFPDKTFVWENYLLACKMCNQTPYKLDRMFVFNPKNSTNSYELPRGINPISDDISFINSRIENPMDFLELNLKDFYFYEKPTSGREFEKAKNTLEILKLNEDNLKKRREHSFKTFKNVLKEYVEVFHSQSFDEIDNATSGDPELDRTKTLQEEKERVLKGLYIQILESCHPTVFQEMLRQKGSQSPHIQDNISIFEKETNFVKYF